MNGTLNININEYATAEHALKYLARADQVPHRTEGEAVLLGFIPKNVGRILDLETGDVRLLALLRLDRRGTRGVVLDFSPTMLNAARERFCGDDDLQVISHNLDESLPNLGCFDVVISSFAIYHSPDERKRALMARFTVR